MDDAEAGFIQAAQRPAETAGQRQPCDSGIRASLNASWEVVEARRDNLARRSVVVNPGVFREA
jgi:hypothetical protein